MGDLKGKPRVKKGGDDKLTRTFLKGRSIPSIGGQCAGGTKKPVGGINWWGRRTLLGGLLWEGGGMRTLGGRRHLSFNSGKGDSSKAKKKRKSWGRKLSEKSFGGWYREDCAILWIQQFLLQVFGGGATSPFGLVRCPHPSVLYPWKAPFYRREFLEGIAKEKLIFLEPPEKGREEGGGKTTHGSKKCCLFSRFFQHKGRGNWDVAGRGGFLV